jgi:hypothetical protein
VEIRFCVLLFSNYKGPTLLSICMVCYSYKQAAMLPLILHYALLNVRMGSVPLYHDVNAFYMFTNITANTTYLKGISHMFLILHALKLRYERVMLKISNTSSEFQKELLDCNGVE